MGRGVWGARVRRKHAEQISALINERNKLTVKYTSDKVLKDSQNYLYELEDDEVIACVKVAKVQWYQ